MYIELRINDTYLNCFALKYVRRFLTHLQLSYTDREKQLVSSLTKWSPFMKDISIILDLMNFLTNKIKPSQWPELFITESKEFLGEDLVLTKEMVETAHIHFDRTTDEELVKFMNQNIKLDDNSLLHKNVIDFIKNLSNESTSDSTSTALYFICTNI